MITKVEIAEKLRTDNRWLERGILAIYKYQTEYEKNRGTTIEDNGVGFNGCDGEFLSSLAIWMGKSYNPEGSRLTPKQAAVARRKMIKYAGQLERIANDQQ